jgi:type VI secretion system secreted protein Hcp
MTFHLAFPRARTVALLLAAAVVAAAAVAALAPRTGTTSAGAATAGVVHIEMKVVGNKTGTFKGDSAQKNHEDQILVSGYVFQVDSPRDLATGQATGRRVYQPVRVTHLLDAASPQFLNACATNELLKSVVINFYETDRAGREVNFYRVTLTDATVSSVKQNTSGATVLEDDSFTFRKVEQDDLIAHTSFIDESTVALS